MKLLRTPLEVLLDCDIPELRKLSRRRAKRIDRTLAYVNAPIATVPIADITAMLDAELALVDLEAAEKLAMFKRVQATIDGIPVQVFPPRFVEWLGAVQEILGVNDVEIPDEMEIVVPESTKGFFDALFDEAGICPDEAL